MERQQARARANVNTQVSVGCFSRVCRSSAPEVPTTVSLTACPGATRAGTAKKKDGAGRARRWLSEGSRGNVQAKGFAMPQSHASRSHVGGGRRLRQQGHATTWSPPPRTLLPHPRALFSRASPRVFLSMSCAPCDLVCAPHRARAPICHPPSVRPSVRPSVPPI